MNLEKSMNVNNIKQLWFEHKTFRMVTVIIVLGLIIYFLAMSIFSTPPKKTKRSDAKQVQTRILDTGQVNQLSNDDAQRIYAEMVSQNKADQAAAKNDREKAERYIAESKSDNAVLKKQIQDLSQQMADMQSGKSNGSRSLDGRRQTQAELQTVGQNSQPYRLNPAAPINSGGYPGTGIIQPQRNSPMRTITQSSIKTSNNGVIEVTPISEQRIVEGKLAKPETGKKLNSDGTAPVDSKARHAARKDEMFLPATSIITGVLISGLEAPTSMSSKSEPFPVTMRIKKDVILPNNFTMDLRDCNMLGSAQGDLASQRAYIRATSLSCVNSKGKAFDVKIEAYAVSEFDGKNGIKGTLISRNGNAITGAAFAGGLSALTQSLSPSRVSSLNIDPNSQAQYQTPNFGALGALAGSGAASGGLNRLVDYYTSIAEQQWPVIEISPGRGITFIVQQGASIPTNLIAR